MSINTQLVTCDDDVSELTEQKSSFSLRNSDAFWCSDTDNGLCGGEALEKLAFLIARKPKKLISHIHRIYHCFQNNLNDQLFAALVDFLVILNKRGYAISWRMLLGAKSHLTIDQFTELQNYLDAGQADTQPLLGNQYTLFTKGFTGTNKMIQQIEKYVDNSNNDPLMIARDHIEYSQLEEAMQVLEEAVLERPERQDLHDELLELYKSTRNSDRFYQMLAELTERGETVADEWNQLDNYFKGQNSNG